MSRIKKIFSKLKKQKKKALIPFITAGDPTLHKSFQYTEALITGGADIIELGMPFSDPMADGPVIQRADERAIKQGTDLKQILKLVQKLRKSYETPIVLMGYYNPIYHYGVERFAKDAAKAGVDGILIADLPVEESGEVSGFLRQVGLDLIFLVAPTSPLERIRKITKKASGYLYYVSMTGITGAKLKAMDRVKKKVKEIQRVSSLPVCVGFGISTPAAAKQVARFADGVVVGSAFVKEIEKKISPQRLAVMTERFKKALSV